MDAVRHFLHEWRLVLLVIHVGVTSAMIIVILLQRSEGGGLGMGGRSDALFSVRGQANVLSRMTAIFASIFFVLSLIMAWSMTDPVRATRSIMDRAPVGSGAPAAPAPGSGGPSSGGMAPAPAAPAAPAQPAAPTR
ncbi:MAG: preprotein translocase subunit SecG [Reyranella sp.]|uniref:preprotein translocase subunit SecG n=1 Tax=Reyranella sp. TaxID=1929291 RepID=UPI0012189692|nr:preprotein translocase subunit SecG [Reyranella sp.]TAJ86940.1 MAG: preprotein translocase subunit SecG [Reyranella sp.]TBR23097.1 MAG: preprotein translocase subunit SecG [Reyranella sp.]